MFEDGPPPLPLPLPSDEVSTPDGTFADLNDENRLTAVADDKYDGERTANILATNKLPSDNNLELSESADHQVMLACAVTLEHTASAEEVMPMNFTKNRHPEGISSCEDVAGNSSSSTLLPSPPHNAHMSVPLRNVDFSRDTDFLGTSAASIISNDYSFHSFHSVTNEPMDGINEVTNVGKTCAVRRVPETGEKIDANLAEVTNSKASSIGVDSSTTDSSYERFREVSPGRGSIPEGRSLDGDDDEFGDFEEFVGADEVKNPVGENVIWANFKADALPQNFAMDDKSVKNVTFGITESILPTLFENLHDDQLWVTTGADDEEKSDYQAIPDNGLHETLSAVVNSESKRKPEEEIWMAVCITEEALALKLRWQQSLARSDFLSSLNVDVNQTTIRHSLPAFAQQLGESTVLTPVLAEENQLKVVTAYENNPLASSNSSDFLPHKHSAKSPISQQLPLRPVTVDSLAVPPAQFDWNNSGLTNPLKPGSVSASSTLLDVDLLGNTNEKNIVSDGPSNMQVFSTLQKDLALFGLASPNDSEKIKFQEEFSSCKPAILGCLMKKNDEKRKYTPVSELSLDARALHDQLPDLDYMLSNVLLFPVFNR